MGKIYKADWLILCSSCYSMLALVVNHGIEIALEPGGIRIIETFGPYLFARRYINSLASFLLLARTLFWAICLLLPIAVYEALTGQPIILNLLSKFVSTFPNSRMEPRFGLERAQVVFEHPILYGAYAASAFGIAFYVVGRNSKFFGQAIRGGIIAFAAIMSVSTGAIVALVAQFFLYAWNVATVTIQGRWKLLSWLCVAAYVFVDVLSNRSPFHVFVTYLTFSTGSAYNRILIWNYGTAEVLRHPIFGIGLNDWVRPRWMSGSMDNFWLTLAVFYGIPTFLMFASAVIIILRTIGKKNLTDKTLVACRYGLLISLGGLIISGMTVHYWNAIYCWFIFLVGSGVWMIDAADQKQHSISADQQIKPPGSGLRRSIIN